MNNLLELASPTLKKHTEEKFKDYLYHYTGAGGLIGLLEYKKLWMSNVEYLNDSQEVKHFANKAVEVAAQMSQDPSIENNQRLFLKFVCAQGLEDIPNHYYVGLNLQGKSRQKVKPHFYID